MPLAYTVPDKFRDNVIIISLFYSSQVGCTALRPPTYWSLSHYGSMHVVEGWDILAVYTSIHVIILLCLFILTANDSTQPKHGWLIMPQVAFYFRCFKKQNVLLLS